MSECLDHQPKKAAVKELAVSGGSTVLLLLIDNPWIADTCFLLSERFYRSGPGRWESDTFSQCRKHSFDITD